ncbi:xanthine dehydrogenase family protein molybdopterin-binding subunit [Actinomadura parmotrematis]|uniref:Xanthine dehydrogenase family protein molybdopterin-binding subunit n=1 Tax=Actinomadura parmotrematis TaxID=2864039 RepID=A0ABS7G4P9_9ACTN|nr:xanthine dehydrogenase family protein molybdopterin-binding subunit [Actinomadura parmotrematis]MBW8486608.1 xanthine dehydrogenase family protein molybdopterin-binding subunit [Actinomadura parmotrematis]
MRVEGREKVTGTARYAYEYPVAGAAYAFAVQAAAGPGRVTAVHDEEVLALPGVIAVLSHRNAPALKPVEDGELALFQSDEVAYRGQVVAAVVAETLDTAREAARLLRVDYDDRPPKVRLSPGDPGLYKPEEVNPSFPADTGQGDPDEAFGASAVRIDATYTTPAEHNNPMEPHATIAEWRDGGLTLHDSNQGASTVAATLAELFDLEPAQVRVVAPHVGGGFGSKGTPRPNVVLAAMAARVTGRPVKFAFTRQQMFATTGYRTPTIQRVRLGADADGTLTTIVHEVVEQTSTVREFAEQAATPTRMMYRAPHRRTAHRLARLDVPTPSWMRAPGETPGMFALECAMDELAFAAGVDPIELRVRNEPDTEPESGLPFSSRNLVACLRRGAELFGWDDRDPAPSVRRRGRKMYGTGVASATYPANLSPSKATAAAAPDGTFTVRIAAADIGTGARTALTAIAAEALKTDASRVTVEIGDSALPKAPLAGGSMGTASWGFAVTRACEALRADLDGGASPPVEASADTTEEVKARGDYARHAFGAQFAEVEVDVDTGEIRVPRMLGVFAAGRIVDPQRARSQFIGGMTMGLGMALMEESTMDERFGDYVNHDLAQYHVPACADVRDIDAVWIEESDPHLNPMGTKGIGEIGIVGAAAAVANALHHATGLRLRDLPLTPAAVLTNL